MTRREATAHEQHCSVATCDHRQCHMANERGVNEPLPGQYTVKMLMDALADQQPHALVGWVEPHPIVGEVMRVITSVEGTGGPVVKLRGTQPGRDG